MALSNEAFAALLLTLPLSKNPHDDPAPLTGSELNLLAFTLSSALGAGLSDLFDLSVDRLIHACGLSGEFAYRVRILIQREIMLMRAIEESANAGFTPCTPVDPAYPAALKNRFEGISAPAVYIRGENLFSDSLNVSVLGAEGVKTPDKAKHELKALINALTPLNAAIITSGRPGAGFYARKFAETVGTPLVTISGGNAAACTQGMVVSLAYPLAPENATSVQAVNSLMCRIASSVFLATVREGELPRSIACPYLYALDVPENAAYTSKGFETVSAITDEWVSAHVPLWCRKAEQLSFL